MSSPNHPTSNIEDAFSSNFSDYTTASPRNISPDPLDNLSKYLFASLAISPFHNVQAYNVVSNKPPIPPQDPITPPTILTPSLCMCVKRTAWNEFSSSMASAVICLATEEDEDDNEVPAAPSPPSHTHKSLPPPQEQSSMSLLNTLMETCATLTQKVSHLEQDKVAQVLEIVKLKEGVKKLEKKRKSKSSILKRLRKVELDADKDVTLVDVDTTVEMDADTQGRMEEDVTAIKEINASKPIVFDDEDVTMTMAQTLIKIKAKKQRILDEQMAKRLQDKEIKQATAREK
nr:hypothetical protein [Tanacetum cinerariifolium]